jgi:hypothetical protein
LRGEPIGPGISKPFKPTDIVVEPNDAFPDPASAPETGAKAVLVNDVKARYVGAAGARRRNGSVYVPSWGGAGWAISPADFVANGGLIMDFGPDGTVALSPTPRSLWDPRTAPIQADAFDPVLRNPKSDPATWLPVWGADLGAYWEFESPVRPGWPLSDARPAPVSSMSNAPAVCEDDRFVLLPGDAGLQHHPEVPPGLVVIGQAAAHHGAHTWLQEGAQAHIPRPGAPNCEHIVYSYGTRLTDSKAGEHPYGHPSPDAIAAYEASGWGSTHPAPGNGSNVRFTRLNTAPLDFLSKAEYDPLGIAVHCQTAQCATDRGHRSGNVALGWDCVQAGPITQDRVPLGKPTAGGALVRSCAKCGQATRYFI